jgi:hypothetical protein
MAYSKPFNSAAASARAVRSGADRRPLVRGRIVAVHLARRPEALAEPAHRIDVPAEAYGADVVALGRQIGGALPLLRGAVVDLHQG